MCTWFYAEKSVLSPIITKAQQLPLTTTIMKSCIYSELVFTDGVRIAVADMAKLDFIEK